MIDPALSLAFSLHANKGVYALLLGSGVSRAAKIPTGWEVVLDLIRKLARLQKANCEPDPASWYQNTFGEGADYSQLLDQLGRSQSDRSQLLRPYFEASEEELAEGIKRPTVAHRAIADLIAGGYIRVVITTNFDRLLEDALEARGIRPVVISTPESVEGARPLIHSGPTIVKIHGDYLDERIKNTLAELQSYDPRLDVLLDRIFSEFGIITCGWSADWDFALLRAFERCSSHRFPMYFTTLNDPSRKASQLIDQRRASVLKIQGADAFFLDLKEKIDALEAFDRPHPLSAKIAVETLKGYLVDDRHRIRIEELVRAETERVVAAVAEDEEEPPQWDLTRFRARVEKLSAASEILVHLTASGSYWGDPKHAHLWVRALERTGAQKHISWTNYWTHLRRYPALCVLYAGCLGALAAGRLDTFAALAKAKLRSGQAEELAFDSGAWSFDGTAAQSLPRLRSVQKGETLLYPLSEHLHAELRGPLKSVVPDDEEYDLLFDRVEYLLALACTVAYKSPRFRGGRFIWRLRRDDRGVAKQLDAEIESLGERWPLLASRFFDVDLAELRGLKAELDKSVDRAGWR